MDHDSCQSFLLNSTEFSSISLNRNLSDNANLNSSIVDTVLVNFKNLSIILKDIKKAVENGDKVKIPYYYPGSTEIWKNLELSDYCKLFAYVIVFFGGFLGNISVILTVAFNKSLWKTIHFYVANLAMADAMICLFCMIPHALSVATNKVYILGKVMCKFNSFAEMTCLISSVITLAAISLDRRFIVLSPYEKYTADPNISLMVTFIWIISIAVSIPLLIVKKLLELEFLNYTDTKCVQKWPIYYYIDKSTMKCIPQQILRFTYYVVVLTTMYFLPVGIMLFAYSSIVWKARKEKFAQEENKDNHNTKPIDWTKVTKNVVFSFFAFVICWTPVQAIMMYSAFIPQNPDSKPDEIPKWIVNITWASQFLAYSNSLINPIIFGGFNKAFREGFCHVLRCIFRKRRLPMPGLSERKCSTKSKVSLKLSKLQSGDYTANQNPNINMNLMHISGNGKIHPSAENRMNEPSLKSIDEAM